MSHKNKTDSEKKVCKDSIFKFFEKKDVKNSAEIQL